MVFLGPEGLYAPQSFQGASEDVCCPNTVGVGSVATACPTDLLSPSVFLFAPATDGTPSGGIGRLYLHKQNTVLLGHLSEPLEHLPICRGCDSLSESLAPILGCLPRFKSSSFSTPHNAKVLPEATGLVNEVVSLPISPFAGYGAGFSPGYPISNPTKLFAVALAVGIYQFIDAISSPTTSPTPSGRLVGNFDPEGDRAFRKCTALNKPTARETQPSTRVLLVGTTILLPLLSVDSRTTK